MHAWTPLPTCSQHAPNAAVLPMRSAGTESQAEVEAARIAGLSQASLVCRLNSLAYLLDALAAQDTAVRDWWQQVHRSRVYVHLEWGPHEGLGEPVGCVDSIVRSRPRGTAARNTLVCW